MTPQEDRPPRDVAQRAVPAPRPPHEDPDQRIGSTDLTAWSAAGRPVVRAGRWVAGRLGPYGAFLLPVLVGLVVFAAGTWAFGEIYEGVQEHADAAVLDRPALALAISLRNPVTDALVTGLTFIGGGVIAPILTALVTGLLVWVRRSWTPAFVIVPAALGSLVMTAVGKHIFGRSRPPHVDAVPPYEYSPSFPSGHTLNAIVIAGIIAYVLLLRRTTTRGRVLTIAVAAAYAILIGLSRVFLGHHWLTDVLAGWVIGAAWLAVVITAHRVFLTVRRSRAGPHGVQRPPSAA